MLNSSIIALVLSIISIMISLPTGFLAWRALRNWHPPGKTAFVASAKFKAYHDLVPGRWELALGDHSVAGGFLISTFRDGQVVDVSRERMTFFPTSPRLTITPDDQGRVGVENITSNVIWIGIEYGDVLGVTNYSGKLVQVK